MTKSLTLIPSLGDDDLGEGGIEINYADVIECISSASTSTFSQPAQLQTANLGWPVSAKGP